MEQILQLNGFGAQHNTEEANNDTNIEDSDDLHTKEQQQEVRRAELGLIVH